MTLGTPSFHRTCRCGKPSGPHARCRDCREAMRAARAARPKLKEALPRRTQVRPGACPAHLTWIRTLPCAVGKAGCGPAEAAHVRQNTGGGMGLKPADRWAVPLCHAHHAEQHAIGHAAFDELHHVELRALAEFLAARSPALTTADAPR